MTGPIHRPDALLVDLDGVLYVEDEPVEGAAEAIGALRDAGLALRFVTNTTARSHAQTLDKLARLGFEVAARSSSPRRRWRGATAVEAGHDASR